MDNSSFYLNENGELVTNSRIVAQMLGKQHYTVLKKFRKFLDEDDYTPKSYKSADGRQVVMYELGFQELHKLLSRLQAYSVLEQFANEVVVKTSEIAEEKPKKSLWSRIVSFFKFKKG